MNSYTIGLVLSVNINYFDNKNKISLQCQSTVNHTPQDIIYMTNGKWHRENGPAFIRTTIYDSIKTVYEVYYVNGLYHRTDGPAITKFKWINGKKQLFSKNYLINNECHRVDGPAAVRYNIINGKLRKNKDMYFLNGKRHRIDGPAYIEYSWINDIRSICDKSNWINGIKY